MVGHGERNGHREENAVEARNRPLGPKDRNDLATRQCKLVYRLTAQFLVRRRITPRTHSKQKIARSIGSMQQYHEPETRGRAVKA